MDYQLIIDSIPILLKGAWITVIVTIISMAFGLIFECSLRFPSYQR
ncbi:hypothetical protein [Neobacillus rhizosphaerae]|nr:hypothetical protein [Neobacillus rhizosphaerae]